MRSRLQHPLGVAVYGRPRLHRRHLQPQDQDARSVVAARCRPLRDGEAGTCRRTGSPGAVLRARRIVRRGNTLYVADTNNHAVRTIDLATGRVGTLVHRRPHAAGGVELPGIRCVVTDDYDRSQSHRRRRLAHRAARQPRRHARVLRLRHLRRLRQGHRRRDLPELIADRLADGVVRRVRGRLSRPADRRHRPQPLRRSLRPPRACSCGRCS